MKRAAFSRWGLPLAVYMSAFLATLDANIVILALPAIESNLRAGATSYQWILDAYILCLSAFALSAGAVADRYGRKRVFLSAVLLFTAASGICASAHSLAVVVAGRFLQGLAAAAMPPSALALLVHGTADSKARARAITLWSTSAMLAALAGPVVGGLLVDHWGWRSIFLINIPIGIAVCLIGAKAIEESADPEHSALDPAGQLLGVLWLAGLSWGLIEGGRQGWTKPSPLIGLGVAFVAFAGFIVVELGQEHPMLPVALVRDRGVVKACLIAFIIGIAPLSVYVFIPTYMQDVQGHAAASTGVLLMPMALANGAGSLIARRWIAERGPHAPMIAGTALAAVGVFLLLQLHPSSRYSMTVIMLVVLGVSVGIATPATNNAAIGAVPPHHSGLAGGLLNAVRQTGYLLGIAIYGVVIAAVSRSGAPSNGAASNGQARPAVPAVPDFTTGLHVIAVIAGALCLIAALTSARTSRHPRGAPGAGASQPASAGQSGPATGRRS